MKTDEIGGAGNDVFGLGSGGFKPGVWACSFSVVNLPRTLKPDHGDDGRARAMLGSYAEPSAPIK